jgi:ABC-type transporter Mla subunit MlaD
MTDTSDIDGTHDNAPKTVDEARKQVEQTRSDLTDTLENLTDKLDAKKQAKAKVHDLSGKVHESAAALSTAAGKAHDALPAPVRQGIDSTAQAVRPAVTSAVTTAKSHRRPLLLASVGGLLALVVARRWRRS